MYLRYAGLVRIGPSPLIAPISATYEQEAISEDVMSEPEDVVTQGDLAFVLAWISSIAKPLIRKGVISKQDVLDELDALSQKAPHPAFADRIALMKKTVNSW
jgi:hypothetical protein